MSETSFTVIYHYISACAVTDIYCLFLQGILAAMRRHPDDKYIQISGR